MQTGAHTGRAQASWREKGDARSREGAGQHAGPGAPALKIERSKGAGGCCPPPKEHGSGQRGGANALRRPLSGGGHLGRPSVVRWAGVSGWDGGRAGGRTGPRGPGREQAWFASALLFFIVVKYTENLPF